MDSDHDLLKRKPASGAKKAAVPKAVPGKEEERALLGNQASLRLLARLPAPLVTRLDGGISAVVYFGRNHFLLEGENFRTVEKIGEELRLLPEPRLTVDGHASGEGTTSHNQGLSERRRFAVIATLTEKIRGKPAVDGKAYGETKPAVEEDAKDPKELEGQRALNRRVEFHVTPSRAPAPEKKPDPRLPMKLEPESPEKRLERILKEKPPEPPPKRSLSEMFWKKFDDKAEDILRRAGVAAQYRPYIKDAARAAIEKGAEKALDAALDQAGMGEKEKRAVKEALKAAGETKF